MRVNVRMLRALSLALLGVMMVRPAIAQSITDDFNQPDGSYDPYFNGYGNWTINNGAIAPQFGSPGIPPTVAFLSSPYSWSRYELNVDSLNSHDGGLYFGTQDYWDSLALIIRPDVGDMYFHIRNIYTTGLGWGPTINHIAIPFAPGSDLHIKLEANDGEYLATVTDGTTTVTDSLNTLMYAGGGTVGLYSNIGNEFDNFSITTTPEPGSLALFAGAALAGGTVLRRRRKSK